MRHHASPSRCRSVPRTTFALLYSALPCFTFATLCSAILHPCSTSHGTAFAALNITMPSLAFASLCASALRFAFATLHIASPLLCNSLSGNAAPYHRCAAHDKATSSLCSALLHITSRCSSVAGQQDALPLRCPSLPRPAIAKRYRAVQCFSFAELASLYSAFAKQFNAALCLCMSELFNAVAILYSSVLYYAIALLFVTPLCLAFAQRSKQCNA